MILRNLIFTFCLFFSLSIQAQVVVDPYLEEVEREEIAALNWDQEAMLADLDKRIVSKWEKYLSWQTNEEWVKEQDRLKISGVIYQKGMLGPVVTRSIVPDKDKGWLVVDTVDIGQDIVLQGAVLAGNLLLHYWVPYISAGPITHKNFVNIRHVAEYKDALLAPIFKFTKMPLTYGLFQQLNDGEIITTKTTGGFYVRAGLGILKLLGVETPLDFDIGPKAKLYVQRSLKFSVSREGENFAMVAVENASDVGGGIGLSMGILFEDLADVPISIGINSRNGYNPIKFNIKANRNQYKSVIYKFDLTDANGLRAYLKLIHHRDFTLAEDLADLGQKSVSREMVKVGHENSLEVNGAIDLLLFRAGFRNIFLSSRYNTTTSDGRKFEYAEIGVENIWDWGGFSGDETISRRFAVLVPLTEDTEDEKVPSFLIDFTYQYGDSKTKGKELQNIMEEVQEMGTHLSIPLLVAKKKDYGDVRIHLDVKFPVDSVRKVLTMDQKNLWISLARASGLPDPMVWNSSDSRQSYLERGANNSETRERKRLLKRAQKMEKWIKRIRNPKTLLNKAKRMLGYLKRGSRGRFLHRSMIEIATEPNIMVRGVVRGRYFR
ncbi:MAG: hypothetical protein HYV97_18090 [Bdellovibrio sp.]|nr:hypothetical protein [Bdellovibrio sp.]